MNVNDSLVQDSDPHVCLENNLPSLSGLVDNDGKTEGGDMALLGDVPFGNSCTPVLLVLPCNPFLRTNWVSEHWVKQFTVYLRKA